jgi:molecular chaperone DnaJ
VDIPTLDGDTERIRIEPGTQSGAVLRLRGRGIPHIGRRARGDLFITINVEIPATLSREERGLLERLAQIRGEMPKKGEGLRARLGKLGDA